MHDFSAQFKAAAEAAATLHAQIANDVYPNGGTLTCSVCGHSRAFSTEDAADYLRRGWPKHCGKTMRSGTQAPGPHQA